MCGMFDRLGAAWLLLVCSRPAVAARAPRSVHDPAVVAAAEFVVEELQQLSDSGVYRTLTLDRVVSATWEQGVFHENTFLVADLASPHFASGNATERFDVVVMRHLDDASATTFAIDEFPVMDDDAVERFLVEKIERHREQREVSFRKIEADFGASSFDDEATAAAVDDGLMILRSSEELIDELRHAALYSDRRRRAEAILRKRAQDDRIDVAVELSKLDTPELDQVARDDSAPLMQRVRRGVAHRAEPCVVDHSRDRPRASTRVLLQSDFEKKAIATQLRQERLGPKSDGG